MEAKIAAKLREGCGVEGGGIGQDLRGEAWQIGARDKSKIL